MLDNNLILLRKNQQKLHVLCHTFETDDDFRTALLRLARAVFRVPNSCERRTIVLVIKNEKTLWL
jgi:hypothetical protein